MARMIRISLCSVLPWLAGWQAEQGSKGDAEGEPRAGVVYLIDGVGGFNLGPRWMAEALAEAGVPHEVRVFYWSHGFGRWHADLTDADNLNQKGTELAETIRDYRLAHPDRPIFIIAKSGGTCIALEALAEMPPDSVERVVLLSAAVSPGYDLLAPLRAVRSEIVSFWSPRDRLILGWGTEVFGTADGVRGKSAGLVKFRVPDDADAVVRSEYRKLREVEWDAAMRRTYNFGGHVGTSMPLFIRQYVAPLVGGKPEPAEDARPPASAPAAGVGNQAARSNQRESPANQSEHAAKARHD